MLNYRKIVFIGSGRVELQKDKLDDSSIPAGHVLLRNHYSLISTGTELACLAGLEDWFKMPSVPGYISVGEIVKMAPNVEGYQIGDIIYNFGGHSELSIMPITGCFMKVPDGIEVKHVPFIRIVSMALTAIRASTIELGDYVAVTGQGMLGVMTAQLAHLQGARAIGVDFHESRLQIAQKCNVDFTINPDRENVLESVKEITRGKMLNTVVEAIGNTQVVVESLPLLAKNGEMILLGTPRTNYDIDASNILMKVFLGDYGIRLKGAHEWQYPYEHNAFKKHSIIRNTEIAIDYMRNGRIIYEPMLTHLCNPEDCSEAYHNLKTDKGTYFGVLFDWTKK